MPHWVEHVMWWHVYPLGFVGAEPAALPDDALHRPAAPVHRLGHLTAWLDYVVGLGLNGIALGPVFASRTHGYDTVDHFRVDPRLGDEGDLDALIAAAHARGLRITLDGVFNHVGRGFGPFQEVLEHGPDAPTAGWFHLDWPPDAGPGTEPGYRDFEGHHALVALNHEEPAVVDHVVAVMNHWLARGIDGWRLDAAYAVPPSFWAQVLPRVRAEYPDAYVFGEVLHGDYVAVVEQAGFDALTQYELWKAVWSSLNDVNFHELAWALSRHNTFLEHFVPLTFIGNHDVTRIASRLTDARHLAHAVVLLFTLGGTPTVYAGDEQGLRGTKEDRAGGDDAVRPTFPPQPGELADVVEGGGWATYHLHTELIGLRRRHPWLHRARTELLTCTNAQIVYRVAAPADVAADADGARALLVALNLADDAVTLDTPSAREVLAGQAHLHDAGPHARITVPAHAWTVLTG